MMRRSCLFPNSCRPCADLTSPEPKDEDRYVSRKHKSSHDTEGNLVAGRGIPWDDGIGYGKAGDVFETVLDDERGVGASLVDIDQICLREVDGD